jgi:hypothetical protein
MWVKERSKRYLWNRINSRVPAIPLYSYLSIVPAIPIYYDNVLTANYTLTTEGKEKDLEVEFSLNF